MTSNLFARHCPQGMPHAPIAPCALALKAKIPGRTPTPSHGNPLSLHATRPALHTINTADHDAKPGRTKNGRGNVTVNLIALRRLEGENGQALRRYVLGLALVAATAPMDGFLRVGCLLTLDPGEEAVWHSVVRTGARTPISLNEEAALNYARTAADAFGVGESCRVAFDKRLAVEDTKAKTKEQ